MGRQIAGGVNTLGVHLSETYKTVKPDTMIRRQRDALVLWAVITLVYLPVVLCVYGFSDDYYWLWRVSAEWSDWRGYWMKYWSDGRPVQFVNLLLLRLAHGDVTNLRWVRIPVILLIGWLGIRLYRFALECGWRRAVAFAMAASIACAPAFQVCANWVICSNYLLGCLAAEATARLMLGKIANGNSVNTTWSRFVWASVINTFSFCCFQPAGCFLWVWTFLWLAQFRGRNSEFRNWLFRFSGVFFASAALAYAVMRACPQVNPRSAITVRPLLKLAWFVVEPLANATGLTSSVYPVIGFLLFLGIAITTRVLRARVRSDFRWHPFLVMAGLLPFAYFPNLVIEESWPAFRTQIALGPCVIVMFWALVQTWKVEPGGVADRLVAGVFAIFLLGIASTQLWRSYALPQAAEWRFVNQQLATIDIPAEGVQVNARRSHWLDSPAGKVRYDEFGTPSSMQEWGLEPMIKLAIRQRTGAAPKKIILLHATDELPPGALDMRRIIELK